jgi:hypothetical protein
MIVLTRQVFAKYMHIIAHHVSIRLSPAQETLPLLVLHSCNQNNEDVQVAAGADAGSGCTFHSLIFAMKCIQREKNDLWICVAVCFLHFQYQDQYV